MTIPLQADLPRGQKNVRYIDQPSRDFHETILPWIDKQISTDNPESIVEIINVIDYEVDQAGGGAYVSACVDLYATNGERYIYEGAWSAGVPFIEDPTNFHTVEKV